MGRHHFGRHRWSQTAAHLFLWTTQNNGVRLKYIAWSRSVTYRLGPVAKVIN